MTRVLRYGEGEALHIDPPPEARLTDLTAPPGKPLADPAAWPLCKPRVPYRA